MPDHHHFTFWFNGVRKNEVSKRMLMMPLPFICRFLLILTSITAEKVEPRSLTLCSSNSWDAHGLCQTINDISSCQCYRWWTLPLNLSHICTYQQKSKLIVSLRVSFCLSFTDANWFYLRIGTVAYMAAGIAKMLALGRICVW